MTWVVRFANSKAKKQYAAMDSDLRDQITALMLEIERLGPVRGNWPNYSKLRGTKNKHHCHVRKGKPTYVVCWEVADKQRRIVEVYYAGTHENAPY